MTSTSHQPSGGDEAPGNAMGPDPKAKRALPLTPIFAFISVWLGGSWLIVGALAHTWLPGGWWAVAAGLGLCALPLWVLARGIGGALYPSALARLLILRPFWYGMLFLPVLAGVGMVGSLAGLPFGAGGETGRWALAAAAAILAVTSIAGFLGTRRLRIQTLEMRSSRLPGAFDGLRIVQLSDLHVGPHTSHQLLERMAQATRVARPDLIVITGDQVDDFAPDVELFTAAFDNLDAPLGVFAIAGNHDVYAGWSAVRHGLEGSGFQVLVNEAVPLVRGGERLWLAGTGDPAGLAWHRGGGSTAAPDIEQTLRDIPAGEWTLALAHNPALWPELARRGVDLTLSGHTHYGQLAIPRWNWSAASPFLKLAMGTHRASDSLLYIHPGSNYWGIPFRLGTPPEVTVLTLRRADDDGVPAISSDDDSSAERL